MIAVVKIRYFRDADTLYIELNRHSPSETQDLDENTSARALNLTQRLQDSFGRERHARDSCVQRR
jgi:Protein of unknown function (DUF2283)